jgi:PPIC-type PPIASE domain
MPASQAHDQPKSTVAASTVAAGGTSVLSAALSALRREPLLHFCLLGGLIFAADHLLQPPVQDNKTIVVSKNMRQSFINGFSEDGDRTPTQEQLNNMIDSWVASEILYREGKALGVDKGDDMIRDRIAFKLQVLLFDQVKLEKPSEEQLRGFFETVRNRFDVPERVSFLLTPATDETSARRQLADIRAERETDEFRDQTRLFPDRPVASLAASFGDSFRDQLLGLTVGEWTVLQAKDGWRVARLDGRRAAVPVCYESVRDQVSRMWGTEETRKRAWAAVQNLKANYTVKIEN